MAEHSPLRPAVFLDRDGTIVEDVDYLTRPEQLRLIPGAAAAIRTLNARAVPVVVVTNQSAVARGLLSEDELAAVHGELRARLAAEGARLDAIYYCPHHPEGSGAYRRDCDCRKPMPGMLRQAARDLGLDLAASAMVGDSVRDLEAGAAAGCRTLILVRTGHGADEEKHLNKSAMQAAVAPDLSAALDYLP
ncbi:MAG TPA: D-glycero-beta-D-manno-heptose 1,7-bisphosphate 7-phosphatase [Alphaproteobacteria bacterium]|jgi:D-glycero-D-manno-heptose 1,7-bisphosphate phosphatase